MFETYSESVLAAADIDGLISLADAKQVCKMHNEEVFEYLNDAGSSGTVWQRIDDEPTLLIKADNLLAWLGY